MSDLVLFASSDRVATITLNRPEARNAVNAEMARALEAAIDRLEEDPDTWVGVLTANTGEQQRPVFCAGADLKVVRETGSAATLDTPRGAFAGFVNRTRTKPIVVAVDGLATAGGFEIVLAADIVVATERSAFGLAELKRNLVAGAGGLFRLPRSIGRLAAMDVILTGEPIDARRAYELGLGSRLVEAGRALEEALRVAASIVEAGPLAVRASRRAVLAATAHEDEEMRQLTTRLLLDVLGSDDAAEGVAAFVEKRPPVDRLKVRSTPCPVRPPRTPRSGVRSGMPGARRSSLPRRASSLGVATTRRG